jgi:hypothetical protein
MDSEKMFVEIFPHTFFTKADHLNTFSRTKRLIAEMSIAGQCSVSFRGFMEHTTSTDFDVYVHFSDCWYMGTSKQIEVVSMTKSLDQTFLKIMVVFGGSLDSIDMPFDRTKACQFIKEKMYVSRETIESMNVKPPGVDFIEYDFKGVNNGQ